jgi:hypothetical protein
MTLILGPHSLEQDFPEVACHRVGDIRGARCGIEQRCANPGERPDVLDQMADPATERVSPALPGSDIQFSPTSQSWRNSTARH